jgi:hypothetical protein
LYNFEPDPTTKKPRGTIEYEVMKNGTNEKVLDYTEDVNSMAGAGAQQITVEKVLPLARLSPGDYTLSLKVTDQVRNQVLTPEATFTVK